MKYTLTKITTLTTIFLFAITIQVHASFSYYNNSIQYTVNPAQQGGTIGVTLSANPASMTLPTNSTTLTWTTSGTPDSCTADLASGPSATTWTGARSAASNPPPESVGSLIAGNYVFRITCSKAGATNSPVNATALVVVNPIPTPSGTLAAGSCSIANGGSSCSASLTWTTSNTTVTPTVDRAYSPFGTVASGISGSTSLTFTPPGSYPFNLMHSGSILSSASVVASCISGTTWNGTICTDVGSPINGLCAPTHWNCSAGTSANNAGTGPWTWQCVGSGGGSTASCSEAVGGPINGVCDTTHWNCLAGTSINNAGTGPWTWQCAGSGGGSTSSCSESVGGGAECSDGIDNDGDKKVDYPADPGCASLSDNSELDRKKPIFKEF